MMFLFLAETSKGLTDETDNTPRDAGSVGFVSDTNKRFGAEISEVRAETPMGMPAKTDNTPPDADSSVSFVSDTPRGQNPWRFLQASARRETGHDDISEAADHWFSYMAISPLDEKPPAMVPNTHPVLAALGSNLTIEEGKNHYETECPICGSVLLVREYANRLIVSCWGKPRCTFSAINAKLGFELTDWILEPAGRAEFYNGFVNNNAEYLDDDDSPSEPLPKRDPTSKF